MRRLALITAASLAFIAISEPPSAEARLPRDELQAEMDAVKAAAEAEVRALEKAYRAEADAVWAAMKKELRAIEKTYRDRFERQ